MSYQAVAPSPEPPQVRASIATTAGVVTAAAAVMVCVFALFGTLSSLELKQAGVGLAAAVLIDVTLIRGVLLHATMKLLGDWNWYLPRQLSWLPRTAHERTQAPRELKPSLEASQRRSVTVLGGRAGAGDEPRGCVL